MSRTAYFTLNKAAVATETQFFKNILKLDQIHVQHFNTQ